MRAVLVARGLIGLWFGTQIVTLHAARLGQTFDVLANYLLVDGLLGIVLALLAFREASRTGAQREWTLAVVFLADGVGRTFAGVGVRIWPGLPGFPVTAVIAIGVMAVCTAAVGLSEFALAADEEIARHGRRHATPQFAAGPTGVASIVAMLFGIAAIAWIGEPERTRTLIGGYVIAAAIVMFGLAWARGPRQRVTA
jgi:hypothetical protein